MAQIVSYRFSSLLTWFQRFMSIPVCACGYMCVSVTLSSKTDDYDDVNAKAHLLS